MRLEAEEEKIKKVGTGCRSGDGLGFVAYKCDLAGVTAIGGGQIMGGDDRFSGRSHSEATIRCFKRGGAGGARSGGGPGTLAGGSTVGGKRRWPVGGTFQKEPESDVGREAYGKA